MLQITPIAINLHTFQKRYNIKLVNQGQDAVIFKILTNTTAYFEIDRNAGCLRPHTRLELMLTVLTRDNFKAKLQILYGKLTNPHLPYAQAWKKLKTNPLNLQSTLINISLRNEDQEDLEQLDDSTYIRPKSVQNKNRKSQANKEESIKRYNNSKISPLIREDMELQYLLNKGGIKKNEQSMKKVMSHIEKERQKHLDAQQRGELLYALEQMDRKYKDELNRNQRLAQQLEIAEKKIQNHSIQMLKNQVGRSLGVNCQEYHTSFTGLTLLALACFLLGYVFALF